MRRACETTQAVVKGLVSAGLLNADAATADVEISPEWWVHCAHSESSKVLSRVRKTAREG